MHKIALPSHFTAVRLPLDRAALLQDLLSMLFGLLADIGTYERTQSAPAPRHVDQNMQTTAIEADDTNYKIWYNNALNFL